MASSVETQMLPDFETSLGLGDALFLVDTFLEVKN